MNKVLLVDDHPVVVAAVKIVLEELGYKKIYVADNGSDALTIIRAHAPGLIVLDLELSGMSGLDLLDRLTAGGLSCRAVIFTSGEAGHYLERCRQAGAMAFVTKSSDLQQLQSAIKAVRTGYTYFPDMGPMGLVHSSLNEQQSIAQLSSRELQILVQLAQGKANKSIASEMSLSHKTISTYKTRLMLKLKVSSLVLLREFAKRNHLI